VVAISPPLSVSVETPPAFIRDIDEAEVPERRRDVEDDDDVVVVVALLYELDPVLTLGLSGNPVCLLYLLPPGPPAASTPDDA
jgi:hypothetical protein